MVLVTRFSPGRRKVTDRKVKGVRIYICNIIKKTNNYTKIIKVCSNIVFPTNLNGRGGIKYTLSYLLTTKLDTEKVKFNNRKK